MLRKPCGYNRHCEALLDGFRLLAAAALGAHGRRLQQATAAPDWPSAGFTVPVRACVVWARACACAWWCSCLRVRVGALVVVGVVVVLLL